MTKDIKIEGLEYLYHDGELYSIILRDSYKGASIQFFTPDWFSQQLGYLPHKKGDLIKPHVHQLNIREIHYTQEVLLIKEGTVKVNFYDKEHCLSFSEMLNKGDIILLCGGGHGFEVFEDTVMIEIKQGPYVAEADKKVFDGE